MKNVDPKYIARAAAVMGACGTACMPVGSLLLSAVVTKVSTEEFLYSACFCSYSCNLSLCKATDGD